MRGLLAAVLLVVARLATAVPAFETVQGEWRPSEAWLLDRHGETLQVVRADFGVRRFSWTPLEEISPVLRDTLVRAEDHRFYDHRGVDWIALAASVRDWVSGGRLRGASTLSMQLAAMLDAGLRNTAGRRTFRQKFRQMRTALALERAWRKEQILEAYLNLAYFRGEIQGIDAASRLLLGKHPSGLDAGDAALLVALLPAPGATADVLMRRACTVAGSARLPIACGAFREAALKMAHRAPSRMEPEALAPHLARQLDPAPGTRIRTTLDAGVQRAATAALAAQLYALRERNVRDGAAIVVDNASGAVLAYVGAAGPWSTARDVDGVRARRQAGSTLKPFLYGMALEKQYLTAASILEDTPVNLETGTGLYIPQNYDRDFKGPVSVRTALAGSLNVPAIRTLVLVGVEAYRDRLHDFGFRGITEDGEYYGYSLALGSAEVSLMEQAAAFRALARGGVSGPLHFVPPGPGAAADGTASGRRVLSPEAAFIVSDILSDDAGRSITFGLDSALSTRFWSAVKTGTSKDMRDNWCIGYSGRYTVAVWVGNFEGDSMHDVSGVSGAAPAWLEIMNHLHDDAPGAAPSPPPGVAAHRVVFESAIEPPRLEWFAAGTEMERVSLARSVSAPGRILSPPNGAIIAVDPDIPREHQQVLIAASGVSQGDRLILDDSPFGSAAGEQLWQPRSGTHILKLLDAEGRERDRVRFVVRAPN